MKRTGLIRLGGLAVMAGGALYAILSLLGLWRLTESVSTVLPLLGVMAATAALHAIQRGSYGWQGTLATFAAFVGAALVIVGMPLVVVAGAHADWLGTVQLIVVAGLLAMTLGLVSMGFVTITTRVLPWWSGAALIVSPIFAVLGPLVGVPWVVVGYAIFRAATRQTEQPSRVR
jgi:hypothetical protein